MKILSPKGEYLMNNIINRVEYVWSLSIGKKADFLPRNDADRKCWVNHRKIPFIMGILRGREEMLYWAKKADFPGKDGKVHSLLIDYFLKMDYDNYILPFLKIYKEGQPGF